MAERFPVRSVWVHLRFSVLVLAVVAPAHDLVYLAAVGIGEHRHALEASGHGAYWTALSIAAVLGAAELGSIAFHRSASLRRRLAQLGGPRFDAPPTRLVLQRIGRLWLALLGAALLVFLVQENLEHHIGHAGHLPGLGVLAAGEYRWALPVFAVLALAAAAIGSLTLERLRLLARAVARAAQHTPRSRSRILRPIGSGMPRRARMSWAPDLGRAPPVLLAL